MMLDREMERLGEADAIAGRPLRTSKLPAGAQRQQPRLRGDAGKMVVVMDVNVPAEAVQVAVDDSPATAAAASSGSTPGCGVMRKSAMMSVSLG